MILQILRGMEDILTREQFRPKKSKVTTTIILLSSLYAIRVLEPFFFQTKVQNLSRRMADGVREGIIQHLKYINLPNTPHHSSRAFLFFTKPQKPNLSQFLAPSKHEASLICCVTCSLSSTCFLLPWLCLPAVLFASFSKLHGPRFLAEANEFLSVLDGRSWLRLCFTSSAYSSAYLKGI